MPSPTFWGMQHLNNEMLCAIKIITGGLDPDLYGILEVCILPLDKFIKPHKEIPVFHMGCAPEDGELIDLEYSTRYVNRDKIAEYKMRCQPRDVMLAGIVNWFESLEMPFRKRIIPVAYDWLPQRDFLIRAMGFDDFNNVFSNKYRDVLNLAAMFNDIHGCRGAIPKYPQLDTARLSRSMGIKHLDQNTAASDVLMVAEMYEILLKQSWDNMLV